MVLEPLGREVSDAAWDQAIAPFPGRLVFHRSAWLRFVEATWHGELHRFRLIAGDAPAGYFAALAVRKGFFRILGSPLTGWLTDYIGPIARSGVDMDDVVPDVEAWCRASGVDFLQLGHPALDPERMRRRGFAVTESPVLVVPLSTSTDVMWRAISSKCRNRIRKAEKSGLSVEEADDAGFADEFFEQHVEVFARQGLPPKYTRDAVRNLCRHLRPQDLLFALRVRLNGETIATGLFPHDDRRVYSFSIASRGESRGCCPNELMYWTIMCRAGTQGIREFSLGGNYRPPPWGRFKEKFNGAEVPVYRFSKSCTVPARLAHQGFRAATWMKQRVRDVWRRQQARDA